MSPLVDKFGSFFLGVQLLVKGASEESDLSAGFP